MRERISLNSFTIITVSIICLGLIIISSFTQIKWLLVVRILLLLLFMIINVMSLIKSHTNLNNK
jgi:uncharacterized membrane protein YfhO